MQPIERVGVFALLFLVVIVGATVLWDPQPEDIATEVAAQSHTAATDDAAGKSTGKVPQLGPTNGDADKKSSTDKTGRKSVKKNGPKTDSKPKSKAAKTAKSKGPLPVSEPGRTLTPAPKPTVAKDFKSARHVPANKPGSSGEKRNAAVVLKPQGAPSSAKTAKTAKSPQKPKAEVVSAKGSGSAANYTVRAGDTLSEISLRELGTSTRWKEIAQLNSVQASELVVGARLRLPARGAKGKSTSAKSGKPVAGGKKTASGAGANYRVKEGDSLWLIAKRTLGDGGRWKEIATLNTDINPDQLVVGDDLILPTGASTRAPLVIAKASSLSGKTTPSKPRVR